VSPDSPKNILIVEDEAIIAMSEKRSLEGFGYKVSVAHSGEKAVEIATASPGIDLILMDIDLGRGMDGTEAARRILQQRNLPIIFNTSHSERAMVDKVRGITRYGYVIKNSGNFVLRSSIEMAFELHEAHRKTMEREQTLLRAESIAEFGSWELDMASRSFTVSEGAKALYGVDADVLTLDYVQRIPCPEYRPLLDRALKGLVEEGLPYAVGFEIVRPRDGRHVSIYSAAKYDAALGRVTGVICDVTEQKKAEEALRDSEKKYRTLFERSNDAIFIVDTATGRYTDVNRAGEVLSGRSLEELRSMLTSEVTPFDARARLARVSGSADSVELGEVVYERPDGSRRTVTLDSIPLLDGLAFGIAHDITEEKLAKDALVESESILREAERIAGLGSYVLDIGSGIWRSSAVLDEVFGIGPEYERSVEGWAALVHPDERAAMLDYFREAVLGRGELFDRDYRILRKGEARLVHGLGKLEYDAQGRPRRMFGTIQDITERKRAEEELQRQKSLLGTFIESLSEAVFAKDAEGRYVTVNRAGLAILGRPLGEVIGRRVGDLLPAETAAAIRAADEAVMSSGLARVIEERAIAHGRTSLYSIHKSPWKDEAGRIIGVVDLSYEIGS
jgi:PAS domain S-box-containing protein